jgi:putative restriction endonuclease
MYAEPDRDLDYRVRQAAFAYLEDQVRHHGEVLPYSVIRTGFPFETKLVKLMGPQGIFKPGILPEMPLSITTAPPKPGQPRPYEDSFTPEGLLQYCYRGTDPMHHENVGLRKAAQNGVPLIYFHGIVKGQYFAAWPAFIVDDNPAKLQFTVAVDDAAYVPKDLFVVADSANDARRAYVTQAVRKRLHQGAFRARVLAAYRERCALCRLGRLELLDAAHIIPDSAPRGEPTTRNGLALCKLHHAAFDASMIGIRPDYVVEVRQDLLDETDGPMLVVGLQGFHHERIILPRHQDERPDPELLEIRYEEFCNSAA